MGRSKQKVGRAPLAERERPPHGTRNQSSCSVSIWLVRVTCKVVFGAQGRWSLLLKPHTRNTQHFEILVWVSVNEGVGEGNNGGDASERAGSTGI